MEISYVNQKEITFSTYAPTAQRRHHQGCDPQCGLSSLPAAACSGLDQSRLESTKLTWRFHLGSPIQVELSSGLSGEFSRFGSGLDSLPEAYVWEESESSHSHPEGLGYNKSWLSCDSSGLRVKSVPPRRFCCSCPIRRPLAVRSSEGINDCLEVRQRRLALILSWGIMRIISG